MKTQLISKYQLGNTVYGYNLENKCPLICEFTVKGIVEHEDELFYANDKKMWIKEEFLFKSKLEAYKELIKQAEKEMQI